MDPEASTKKLLGRSQTENVFRIAFNGKLDQSTIYLDCKSRRARLHVIDFFYQTGHLNLKLSPLITKT